MDTEKEVTMELLGLQLPPMSERSVSLAKFSIRPQRHAFIIDINLDSPLIHKIIVANTQMWGGFYNLFIPCDAGEIGENWLEALSDYDPDRLVFCGDIPQSTRKELVQHIQPFGDLTLKSNLAPLYRKSRPLPMYSVFADVERELRGGGESNIRTAEISPEHPFAHHNAVQFGVLDDEHLTFVTTTLKASAVSFSESGELGAYLDDIRNVLRKVYPLALTSHRLQPSLQFTSQFDAAVVFGDISDVESMCLFWNLRFGADGTNPNQHETYVYLPFESVTSDENLVLLANWLSYSMKEKSLLLLLSSAVNLDSLTNVANRIKPLLPKGSVVYPRTMQAELPFSKVVESEVRREVAWFGTSTRFEVPKPSFDTSWIREGERWVVDCDFEDKTAGRQSYFPPRRTGQSSLLAEETNRGRQVWSVYGEQWRLFHQGVSCQATIRDQHVELTLPSETQVLERVATVKGYQFRLSEKCNYVRSFIEILKEGGIYHQLKDRRIQRIFDKLSGGESFTLEQLHSIGQFKHEKTLLEEFILGLLRVGGIFRGIRNRCPVCSLLSWYPMASIDATISCTGCKSRFQTPITIRPAYMLNSLLAMAVRQGSISVALTQPVLQALAEKTYLCIPGALLTDAQNLECDIDIVASSDGHLLVAECKSLVNRRGADPAEDVVTQLRKDVLVAKSLGASVFAVALLSSTPPQDIVDFIIEVNSSGDLPVAIVIDVIDMERGHLVVKNDSQTQPDNNREERMYLERLIRIGHTH